MPNLTAGGLSTLFWALAMLQHQPPNFWLEEALGCLADKLPAVPKVGRQCSTWMVCGAAMQRQNEGAAARRALLVVCPHLQSACGLPFANVVWALSVWQSALPSPAWFAAFCK